MQNIKNLILMRYEIKFKNKKQSHILNNNHHTTFSKKKKNATQHVMTLPQLCRYCPLWGPYPSWFCSSPGCIGEKASTHWREVIPYKHILMCFPRRCGIPWNVRPPVLGHYTIKIITRFILLKILKKYIIAIIY